MMVNISVKFHEIISNRFLHYRADNALAQLMKSVDPDRLAYNLDRHCLS